MVTPVDNRAPADDRPPDAAPMSLTGRHIFVAGATGRIGATVADTLAALGAEVVVHSGRSIERARALAADLAERHGMPAAGMQADLTDSAQTAALPAGLAASGVTGLDALVNCVTGFSGAPSPVDRLDAEEFRRVVEVDLVASYALVRALLGLLQNRAGQVILLGSLAGVRGRPGAAHLCAAKAGVAGLVRALSSELRPSGMSVNAVAPGPVVAAGEDRPPGLPAGMAVSSPQDVARVVAFAASGWNSGIDGQVLVVEGTQRGATDPEGGR